MVDSHCHLTDARLIEQIDAVVARAVAAGVERMVTIGTDPEDWGRCAAVCRRFGQVRCALGIHPNHATRQSLDQIAALRSAAADPAVVALGEMGLDYFHSLAPRELQVAVFEAQTALAEEMGLPVVIHSREAVDDCLAVLARRPRLRAVFHCFTGTMEEARRVVGAGHLLGFTGALTFKKSGALREVAAWAPGERILVETDAPYLSPEPLRKQKVNEPALVIHTAAVLAQVRAVSVERIDEITTRNAEGFFAWTGGSRSRGGEGV